MSGGIILICTLQENESKFHKSGGIQVENDNMDLGQTLHNIPQQACHCESFRNTQRCGNPEECSPPSLILAGQHHAGQIITCP